MLVRTPWVLLVRNDSQPREKQQMGGGGDPLTITDGFSRFPIECRAVARNASRDKKVSSMVRPRTRSKMSRIFQAGDDLLGRVRGCLLSQLSSAEGKKGGRRLTGDERRRRGITPTPNANFTWVQWP